MLKTLKCRPSLVKDLNRETSCAYELKLKFKLLIVLKFLFRVHAIPDKMSTNKSQNLI